MSQNTKITNKKPSLSYIVVEMTIDELYNRFLIACQNKQFQRGAQILVEIVSACYNSKENQFYLCRNLNMPFTTGPVSINSIPNGMNFAELIILMEHVKKVKEYYFCWVIYFNEDLELWSVKFMKFYEIQQYWQYFNVKSNLIGIYVGKTINQAESCRSTKKQNEQCQTFDQFDVSKQKSFVICKKQKKANNFTFDQTYFQKKNPSDKMKSYLKRPNIKEKSVSMKQSQFKKNSKYSNTNLSNNISCATITTKNAKSTNFAFENKQKKAQSTAIPNEEKDLFVFTKATQNKPEMNFNKSNKVDATYENQLKCASKNLFYHSYKRINQQNTIGQKGKRSISKQRAISPNCLLQKKLNNQNGSTNLAKFIKGKSIKKLKIAK